MGGEDADKTAGGVERGDRGEGRGEEGQGGEGGERGEDSKEQKMLSPGGREETWEATEEETVDVSLEEMSAAMPAATSDGD